MNADVDFPAPTDGSAGGIHAKILDRSAHSFIGRWILRSNGVELERIENYDVAAAMVNDVTYSREQKAIHFNEGFPTAQVPQGLGNNYVAKPSYVHFKHIALGGVDNLNYTAERSTIGDYTKPLAAG